VCKKFICTGPIQRSIEVHLLEVPFHHEQFRRYVTAFVKIAAVVNTLVLTAALLVYVLALAACLTAVR
jgi:hypothetical protein